MVSIWQWPLSMASGWLWQSEADQCHCNPRKIQQLRLGDPIPHALQWHWEELETLSSRWEYLGESLWESKDTQLTKLQMCDLDPLCPGVAWLEVDLAGFCFVLFLCYCSLVLAKWERNANKEQGGGDTDPHCCVLTLHHAFLIVVGKSYLSKWTHPLPQVLVYF